MSFNPTFKNLDKVGERLTSNEEYDEEEADVSILSRLNCMEKQIGRLNSQMEISIAEIELAKGGPSGDVTIESVPRLNITSGDLILETGSYEIESDQDFKEGSNFDRHNFALRSKSIIRKAEESKEEQ